MRQSQSAVLERGVDLESVHETEPFEVAWAAEARWYVQFLRPATGDRVSCTATIVRAGKSLIFARATLIAEPSGKDVAAATATFAVP